MNVPEITDRQFRKYGAEPISVVLLHGGPGGIGEMTPVALRLSSSFGVLEHFQTRFSIQEELLVLRALIENKTMPPIVLLFLGNVGIRHGLKEKREISFSLSCKMNFNKRLKASAT